MDSAELNRRLAEVADADVMDRGDTGGKGIAYYGWYWRDVDWDRPISLAYPRKLRELGHERDGWVGFCENNKWDHPEFTCTPEQSAELRRLAEAIVAGPVGEMKVRMEALFDYMQSLRPQKSGEQEQAVS